MSQKISFAVEDVKLIDERNDSQFALVQIDAFASGKNRHDMFTSVETLKRTAKSILLKPLVFIYDRVLDDVGTHDKGEVPCGFVPADAKIDFRELPDGRTMMSVNALIWKHYSQGVLHFFARDNNVKPVSVELDLIDKQFMKDGLTEILDCVYCAITILGTYVTPAIPGAEMSVIKFSKEDYEKEFQKEFSSKYEDIDFTIPEEVKKNCQDALNMWDEMDAGETTKTVSVATARHLVKNKSITLEKFRQLKKYIPKQFKENDLNSLLWGGRDGESWINSMSTKIKELDDKQVSYFGGNLENKKENIKKEEMSMTDKEKEAEAEKLAMATEGSQEEEKTESPPEEKKEDMAVDSKTDEKKEGQKEEKSETSDEEKKEDEKEKFSNDVYMDVPVALAFLEAKDMADQEMLAAYGSNMQMAADELKKEDKQFDFAKVFSGMVAYAKMCNAKMEKMAKDTEVCMAENVELKKFKADEDAKQKVFAVNETIKQLTGKFAIPQATVDDMVSESEKFEFSNIDAWKNNVKAQCVDFAVKEISDDEKETIIRMGMPFTGNIAAPKNDLWAQRS